MQSISPLTILQTSLQVKFPLYSYGHKFCCQVFEALRNRTIFQHIFFSFGSLRIIMTVQKHFPKSATWIFVSKNCIMSLLEVKALILHIQRLLLATFCVCDTLSATHASPYIRTKLCVFIFMPIRVDEWRLRYVAKVKRIR